MKRSAICLLGCILNIVLLFAGVLLVAFFPLVQTWMMQHGLKLILADAVFLILCLMIGLGILKLDVDCLFLKYEKTEEKVGEHVVIVGFAILLVIAIFLQMTVAVVVNITGTVLQPYQEMRFFTVPRLLLFNLIMAFASFLAYQYFRFKGL